MTRRHFNHIAWNLRLEAERITDETAPESDTRRDRQTQWHRDVLAMADVCAQFNTNFDRSRFLAAAGHARREDGSMFPMAPPS